MTMKKSRLFSALFSLCLTPPVLGALPLLHEPDSSHVPEPIEASGDAQQAYNFSERNFWHAVETHFSGQEIPNLADKDLVLFFGHTGSGKSTTVNYLLGHHMEEKRMGRKKKVRIKDSTPKGLPMASIGHNSHSKTIIPRIYTCQKEGLSYMDCPGFLDSNGIEQEAFNCMMVRFFAERCKRVKAVAVVLPDAKIDDARGAALIEYLRYLSKNFGLLPNNLDNIVWLFTHCLYEDTTAEELIEGIDKVRQARRSVYEGAKEKKKEDAKAIDLLDDMLAYRHNILPVHPLDEGVSRTKILAVLQRIQQSIPTHKFKIAVTETLDVQCAIKKIFRKQKKALDAYTKKIRACAQLLSTTEEKQKLDHMLSNPKQKERSLNIYTTLQKEKIRKLEEQASEKALKIAKMASVAEETVLHKTVTKQLQASLFGSSLDVVLEYDDLRFEFCITEYMVTKEKETRNEAKGKYRATFKGPATVSVSFFVKKKHLHKKEWKKECKYLQSIQNNLKKEAYLLTEAERKNHYRGKIPDKEQQKGLQLLKDQQKALQEKCTQLQKDLSDYDQEIRQHASRLDFIFHMHPLLYDKKESIPATLRVFADTYRIQATKGGPSTDQGSLENEDQDDEKTNDER